MYRLTVGERRAAVDRSDGGYVLTFTEHSANVRHAVFSLDRCAAEFGSDEGNVCIRKLCDFV